MKILNFIKKSLEGNFSEDKKLIELKEVSKNDILPDELFQIIKVLKKTQSFSLDFPESLDICGTGGSNLSRINTSTICAIILSKMGIKILKHGNKASSGRFGSFDLLEGLGEKIDLSKKEIVDKYEKTNLAFLYAKNFFPVMGIFANVRKQYGKSTIFNILGPLLAPGNPDIQLIGVSDESKMDLMIKTCKLLGRKKAVIVCGEDRLDDITLSGETKVCEFDGKNIKKYSVFPEDFGIKRISNFSEIEGGNKAFNIKIAKEIISGNCKTRHLDLILINCSFILTFLGKVDNYKEGVNMVKNFIKNKVN